MIIKVSKDILLSISPINIDLLKNKMDVAVSKFCFKDEKHVWVRDIYKNITLKDGWNEWMERNIGNAVWAIW